MVTNKYFLARASGFTPAQSAAYARGARLPVYTAAAYEAGKAEQQLIRNLRNARTRMLFAGRVGWRIAWHTVRLENYRAACEVEQEFSYEKV